MRTQHQQQNTKKTTSLFSCAFFRQCTESPLSPTPPPTSPPLPSPRPGPGPGPSPRLNTVSLISPPPLSAFNHPSKPSSSSSSSSSSASQSFTQWRFPPTHPTNPQPQPDLANLFQMANLHFASESISDHLTALQALEQTLVPNPNSISLTIPHSVMNGVILNLSVKSATKILLALCLSETNRLVAISCGAPSRVLDLLPDLDGPVAERALAALDLMSTVIDGVEQVRGHALAVPMLVAVMGKMEGRGREYAISVLAAVYGGGDGGVWEVAPAEEVARAVVLAMQHGDCSSRGKRKGALLLKLLQDHARLDLN